jgi:hypothetical protein
MLPVILAATLSVSQVLPAFEQFCTNTGIEIGHPITESMITKQIVDEKHQRVQVRIQEKYWLTWYKGKVDEFDDLNEAVHRRLSRSDPADMMRWSQQPCLLDETEALEMATGIFRRLGYDENGFDSAKVEHYRWAPSPVNPDRFFLLPIFDVRWYRKGYSSGQPVPQYVELIISGTLRGPVHFFDATFPEGFVSRTLTEALSKVASAYEKEPSITLKEAGTLCEPLLRAIGAQINGPLKEHGTLYEPDPSFGLPPILEVDKRFQFRISHHCVREFYDLNERPLMLLADCHPDRVQKLAQQQCVVTDTEALAIASRIFRKLGYSEGDFDPPRASRHLNATGYLDNPPAPLQLPDSYIVEWVGKRRLQALLGQPESLRMEISGATSNLIFFTHL